MLNYKSCLRGKIVSKLFLNIEKNNCMFLSNKKLTLNNLTIIQNYAAGTLLNVLVW